MSEMSKMSEMSYDIIDYSEFDHETIRYGPVITSRIFNSNRIEVNNSKNNTLVLRTPIMRTSKIRKFDCSTPSYSVYLNYQSSLNSEMFYKKIKEFELKIISDCVKNSEEWFGKKMTKELVENMFIPMVRYPTDSETYEPDMSKPQIMPLRIQHREGVFDVEFYNMDKSVIFNSENAKSFLMKEDFESIIPDDSYMVACIKCRCIWYCNGKIGVSWELIQSILNDYDEMDEVPH